MWQAIEAECPRVHPHVRLCGFSIQVVACIDGQDPVRGSRA